MPEFSICERRPATFEFSKTNGYLAHGTSHALPDEIPIKIKLGWDPSLDSIHGRRDENCSIVADP